MHVHCTDLSWQPWIQIEVLAAVGVILVKNVNQSRGNIYRKYMYSTVNLWIYGSKLCRDGMENINRSNNWTCLRRLQLHKRNLHGYGPSTWRLYNLKLCNSSDILNLFGIFTAWFSLCNSSDFFSLMGVFLPRKESRTRHMMGGPKSFAPKRFRVCKIKTEIALNLWNTFLLKIVRHHCNTAWNRQNIFPSCLSKWFF